MKETMGQNARRDAEGMCRREKYWSELTDSEKIERMRDEVKRWQYKCAEMQNVVDKLHSHQHAPNGEIVVPLRCSGSELVRPYRNDAESRF